MILDEAIIHCEIVAKSNEKLAEFYYKDPGKNQKSGDACQECAAEHRQLAEWLRDYKRLKEREPCEDAISRQAVKEQMIQYGFHAPDMTITEFVGDLPPVNPKEPKVGWIPVSEKLPEEHKKVIVSDVFDSIYIGEFINAEENWGGEHFINEHGMHSKSVKAWMPLPEPYQSEIPTGSERSDKVNCDKAECYNCVNHGYCDYEAERARNKE